MRYAGIIVALFIALLAPVMPVHAAAVESGVYVCVEMSDGACTEFATVDEYEMGIDTNAGLYVGAAIAVVLGLWILGLGIGAVWRFFDAALGGPLS